MLILQRKEGDWLTITHRNGDVMRLRVVDIRRGDKWATCRLVFDDSALNFAIERPERKPRPGEPCRSE